MNSSFLIQLGVLLSVCVLPVLGFKIICRTKEKTKDSYVGSAAKSMGSLFSPHLSYIKEMEGMIVNEVKKTEPRDDNS